MKGEERELWLRCQLDDLEAREQLIVRYLSKARFWANRFSKHISWVSPEDLLQTAFVGLIVGVDHFEVSRGLEFDTYGRYWIQAAIWADPDVARVAKRQRKIYRQVMRAHDILTQELHRAPDETEIAFRTGLTPKQIDSALTAVELGFPLPLADLGEEIGGSRVAIGDLSDEHLEVKEAFEQALSRLSPTERIVVVYRHSYGLPDKEIGQRIGKTPNAVKQIRHRAMRKIGRGSGGELHEAR